MPNQYPTKDQMTHHLRDLARQLLTSGSVELVIGYTAGTQPGLAAPCIIHDASDADRLIFDRTCETNLTNYLRRYRGRKIATVVKGCDERSLIGLVQEKQLDREDITVIGTPCKGVIDRKRIARELNLARIDSIEVTDDNVLITADGQTTALPFEDAVYPGCRVCAVHNPRFAEHLIGEPVEQPAVPDYVPQVAEVEGADSLERWETFRQEMDKCILCFACRNLCPACYCNQCFTDSSQPKWMGRTDDAPDAMFFQMTRLLHLAGRCTGCGACERGCPVGVNLKLFNDKLRKDAKNFFEFEAGMDPNAEPPLTSFRMNDKNDFIK